MSHATIYRSVHDVELQQRIEAAAQKEARANDELGATPFGQQLIANPEWAYVFWWPIAIDYEAEYAYAIGEGNEHPGADPGVITDANISTAIQVHWPEGSTSGPPPAMAEVST